MSSTTGPSAELNLDHFRTVRLFLYGLTIAVVAATSFAQIWTTSLRFDPAHWPEHRPTSTPMFSANDRSRWCTVWSLVERQTYQIDAIIQVPGWDTIDKVRYQGHFYSSKPALLPTLLAGVYWVLKQSAGYDLLRDPHGTIHVILLLVNWLPMLISLVLYAAIGERYARSDQSRVYLMFCAAWGTLLSTFLVTLNNHNIAATSTLFALYPALRILVDGQRRGWLFALAGFWAAFSVCNELPGCLFGVVMFVILCRASWRKTGLFFVPAALIPLIGFFVTTWLCTGSWKPFYLLFGAEGENPYRYIHEGIPSYWMNPSRTDQSTDSPLMYLFHCTLGHHGIVSLSPIFLLTLVGWCYRRWWVASPLRTLHGVSIGLTVWLLGFYLLQTDSYNYGGNTSGLRWAFWMSPFWLLGLVPVVDALGNRRWFRWLCTLLLAVSVFSAVYPHVNPWQRPWLQAWWEEWGWMERKSSTPRPRKTPRNTWLASLPTDDSAPHPWIEFSGIGTAGSRLSLRLERVDRQQIDGQWFQNVQVLRRETLAGQPLEQTLSLRISESAFAANQTPAKFLQPVDPADAQQQSVALAFLDGLPTQRAYRFSGTRYLKTPLRPDAFRCELYRAQVRQKDPETGSPLNYRCDVWLSDKVPFGVLLIEEVVTDLSDNSVIYRQKLTATSSSASFQENGLERRD